MSRLRKDPKDPVANRFYLGVLNINQLDSLHKERQEAVLAEMHELYTEITGEPIK
jgi:hypothetical protein